MESIIQELNKKMFTRLSKHEPIDYIKYPEKWNFDPFINDTNDTNDNDEEDLFINNETGVIVTYSSILDVPVFFGLFIDESSGKSLDDSLIKQLNILPAVDCSDKIKDWIKKSNLYIPLVINNTSKETEQHNEHHEQPKHQKNTEKDVSPVVELEEDSTICPCCTQEFTKTVRKPIECSYCHKKSCLSCNKTYLLSSIHSSHCMFCKVSWNDDFLRDQFTNNWLTNEYSQKEWE